jgi:predicted RNase H-like HicB family nuclease
VQYEVLIYHNSESDFYAASVPDLPGCRSQGESLEDAERNIREAIELHLAGLQSAGRSIPESGRHTRP